MAGMTGSDIEPSAKPSAWEACFPSAAATPRVAPRPFVDPIREVVTR